MQLLPSHFFTAVESGRIWNVEQVQNLFLREAIIVPFTSEGLKIIYEMTDWMRKMLKSVKNQHLSLSERVNVAPSHYSRNTCAEIHMEESQSEQAHSE